MDGKAQDDAGEQTRRPTGWVTFGCGEPIPVYGDVELTVEEPLIDGTVAHHTTVINAEEPTRFISSADVN